MEKSKEEEGKHTIEATPLAGGAGAVDLVGVNVRRLGVFVDVLKEKKIFKDIENISVDKTNVDVELNREEDGAAERRGIGTICTLRRITENKGRGRIDTYLETSSTTVS